MNIILQHWSGNINELGNLSSINIKEYANFCGADYKLLRGDVFNSELTPPCQKLYMLDEVWDKYDMVVMLDMDIFVRKNMKENIFTDINGFGMSTKFQSDLFKRMKRQFPSLSSIRHPFFGGAVYRLERKIRQELRERFNINEMRQFNHQFQDEGIIHRLLTLSDNKPQPLPGQYKWCHCSYRDGIEDAALIHIRTKVTPTGPKRDKIKNYQELVKRDLI